MMAKIEWYKEVLELEPSSKVFFPLARLLVEHGHVADAITTLRSGLEHHPEFIEARLFLIDMLHKEGQNSQCGSEVARLAGLFRAYPGFWDAWGQSSSTDAHNPDMAFALTLLATMFRQQEVTLMDVLAAGLQAVRHQSTSEQGSQPFCPQPAPSLASAALAAPLPQPSSPMPAPSTPNAGQQNIYQSSVFSDTDNSFDDSFDDALDALDAQDSLDDESSPDYEDPCSMPYPIFAPEAPTSGPAPQAEKLDEGDTSEATPDYPGRAELNAMSAQFAQSVQLLQNNAPMSAAVLARATVAGTFPFTRAWSNDAAGKCSLRTRSMAEVLAEQGDVQGAVDIYQELVAAAADAERPTLEKRLQELRDPHGVAERALTAKESAPHSSALQSPFGKFSDVSALQPLSEGEQEPDEPETEQEAKNSAAQAQPSLETQPENTPGMAEESAPENLNFDFAADLNWDDTLPLDDDFVLAQDSENFDHALEPASDIFEASAKPDPDLTLTLLSEAQLSAVPSGKTFSEPAFDLEGAVLSPQNSVFSVPSSQHLTSSLQEAGQSYTVGTPKKPRMVNLLEHLAQRLENRASR